MKKKSIYTIGVILLSIFASSCFSAGKTDKTQITTAEATSETEAAGIPFITLSNGVKMPQFGLGTFAQGSDDVCYDSCMEALKAGYRHIDTAHAYFDERGVGRAVKDSKIPREEIWITSKLWPSEYGEGVTLPAIDKMLERLGVDYIDLVYLHQPAGDFVGAWKDLEKAYTQGKVRALGISNFDVDESVYNQIMQAATVKPHVMQIELNPRAQRLDIRKIAVRDNIAVEGWFPLGHGDAGLLNDSTIRAIGEKYGKTNAQIILRWHIQEGFSTIPGSKNPAHIRENIDIFDFALTESEMQTMRSLNEEKRFYNTTLEQTQQFINSYGNRVNEY